MKPRSIDPSFWEDLDVIRCSRDERLLLVAMITAGADDFGKLKANAPYLKRLAFAFDDDISIDDTEQMIHNIGSQCKNVRLYEVNGERYAIFANWKRYQSIKYQRNSVLPDPVDGQGVNYPKSADFDANSPKSDDHSKNLTLVGLGRVGLSSVGLGSSGAASENPAPDAVPTPPTPSQDSGGAEGSVNPDDARVANAFCAAFRGTPTGRTWQELEAMMQETNGRDGHTGAEWVLAAIEEASASSRGGPPNMKFLQSIVDRWLRDGFKAARGSPKVNPNGVIVGIPGRLK